ncbi:HAMP domain-containing histidine kinase [Flaviflexus salsibiostraticola]|uniref:histidine kinase n=1 Tax=Flaviflexus salsibiostraticola TaxID=1282737 RepID=A0A3S8ZAN0_9ACTO|nr:HAMP domain-containing sensor histidine kinase [Flaviflexus salsibiostraticola]AZN30531.1 HAMP domain-containing histidine kinase [Flaviflexus salsibiostraticola]
MRSERSLTGRLVALYVLILSLALGAVFISTMTVMNQVLMNQVDDDLRSSGATIAQQTFSAMVGTDIQVVPSPYYIYVRNEAAADWQFMSPSMQERYGRPLDVSPVFSEEPASPITVPGTIEHSTWRVMYLNTVSEQFPAVAIAYPLATMEQTKAQMMLILFIIATCIVALGAIVSYFMVQHSLKPLRIIEHTTRKISQGDLSQRVPTENLGIEVGHLAGSINIMLGQIEASMQVRQRSEAQMRRFVSDASHELRTPLASVRGYAELYRIGGIPDDKIGTAMDRIESEARRMGGLVEDLLQLARLDESRPLTMTSADLVEIAEGTVLDFHARAPEYPAKVTGLHGEKPSRAVAWVDKDKISQVISNLLSNVRQHTPAGTPVEVAVGVEQMNAVTGTVNMAVIEVRDHGPGIPAEHQAKAFERFFRSDSSRSRASGGSGLGLAIVSSIAAAHHGSANISETPGGGTTVSLNFPIPAAPQEEKRPQAQGLRPAVGRAPKASQTFPWRRR